MKETNNEIEVDLGKLLKYYLRHWLALVISGVGMALLALLVTMFLITPKYQTQVSFYVNNYQNQNQQQYIDNGSLMTSQKLVESYMNIIQSDTVLDKVIHNGGLTCTIQELRNMISSQQMGETEVFSVKITHTDGKEAAKIANAIAETAPKQIAKIVKGSSAAVIDYAKEPTSPSSPSYPKNVVMGGLLGGILMGVALTFQYLCDSRVSDADELAQRYNSPVLGTIPVFENEERKKESLAKGGQRV